MNQPAQASPAGDPDRAEIEAAWPRILDEWKTLLRFRSISADPGCRDACRNCAQWLADHLKGMGFSAELLPTTSNPAVLAHYDGDVPGLPTVLLYGHYDVQPADPESAWDSPPFEPAVRGDRVYARGAQDNKGQVFAILKAIESLRRQRTSLPPLTILLEGDEESGQDVLSKQLDGWRDRLAADVLWVSDTDAAAVDRPAIVMGLRGIVTLTVTVEGLRHDLHSGLHGGVAPNPALGLARLLATLHDADGRIAVRDFDADVMAPEAAERDLALQWPGLSESAYRDQTGAAPVGGEPGYAPAERLGFRPCIDVNGLLSGYTGAGSKTIIPAKAMAKVSARLAAGQDPALALQRLIDHVKQHEPRGLTVTVSEAHVGGTALRVKLNSPIVRKARAILRELFDVESLCLWEGASIPVLTHLAQVAGAEPLLVGFGLPDDRIHAPNESFRIGSFHAGYLFAARFLRAMGKA